MRLLSRLQDKRDAIAAVSELVDEVERETQLQPLVPLLNQAAFLSHAYVVLVWLRERMSGQIDYLDLGELDLPDVVSVLEHGEIDRGKKSCPTDMSQPKQILRTLRNAISHGRFSLAMMIVGSSQTRTRTRTREFASASAGTTSAGFATPRCSATRRSSTQTKSQKHTTGTGGAGRRVSPTLGRWRGGATRQLLGTARVALCSWEP